VTRRFSASRGIGGLEAEIRVGKYFFAARGTEASHTAITDHYRPFPPPAATLMSFCPQCARIVRKAFHEQPHRMRLLSDDMNKSSPCFCHDERAREQTPGADGRGLNRTIGAATSQHHHLALVKSPPLRTGSPRATGVCRLGNHAQSSGTCPALRQRALAPTK